MAHDKEVVRPSVERLTPELFERFLGQTLPLIEGGVIQSVEFAAAKGGSFVIKSAEPYLLGNDEPYDMGNYDPLSYKPKPKKYVSEFKFDHLKLYGFQGELHGWGCHAGAIAVAGYSGGIGNDRGIDANNFSYWTQVNTDMTDITYEYDPETSYQLSFPGDE